MSLFVLRYVTQPITIRIARGMAKPAPIFLATVQLMSLPSLGASASAPSADAVVDGDARVGGQGPDVEDRHPLGRDAANHGRVTLVAGGYTGGDFPSPHPQHPQHVVREKPEGHPARL